MKTTAIWQKATQMPARSSGRTNAHAAVEPVAPIGKTPREDDGSRHDGARVGRQILLPPRTSVGDGRDLRFLAQILGQRMEPTPGTAQHRAGVASYPSLELRPETAAEETLLLTLVGPQAIDVLA